MWNSIASSTLSLNTLSMPIPSLSELFHEQNKTTKVKHIEQHSTHTQKYNHKYTHIKNKNNTNKNLKFGAKI